MTEKMSESGVDIFVIDSDKAAANWVCVFGFWTAEHNRTIPANEGRSLPSPSHLFSVCSEVFPFVSVGILKSPFFSVGLLSLL
jgi:hypothetical protein